jgi:GNAT superfamily N-acetyltransferase
MYGFLRSRQLEGTLPGDAKTGIWPITCLRIGYGWGVIRAEDWPDPTDGGQWPPAEPDGLDSLAKRMRLGHYQRVRSLEDCRQALAVGQPPSVSFQITEDWFHAELGEIPNPQPDDKIIGSHCVTLVGYDNDTGKLKFANSWGREWGDEGFGTLSYDYYEHRSVESWVQTLASCTWALAKEAVPSSNAYEPGAIDVRRMAWGVRDILRGGVLHGCELYDLANDERIGWAFAVPRDGFLDIEELFVRPPYRRRGYGTRLSQILLKRSVLLNLPLRLWVSYADCGQENRAVLEGVLSKLDLQLTNSSCRWAAYVALGGIPSAQPIEPIVMPGRPEMIRGAWKAAAAVLASSLALGSAACGPTGKERHHFSRGEAASSGFVLPPDYQDVEPMQFTDDGLPGVEYDLVLTAPPNESIKCLGVVTTISEGRSDLPITDSDWAGIVLGDDEA